MDLEAPMRRRVTETLSGHFECRELVNVRRTNGRNGEVDILLLPRYEPLKGAPICIEVKNIPRITDRILGPWIKQAADYVGAIAFGSKTPIIASFLWIVDVDVGHDQEDRLRRCGMIQLAQHFRVGVVCRDARQRVVLRFGPSADIFCLRTDGREPWNAKAVERLFAKRVDAGTRRPLTLHPPSQALQSIRKEDVERT